MHSTRLGPPMISRIVAIVLLMATSGCTSSGSGDVTGTRTSILGPGASIITSGRPERGTSEALVSDQGDRRRAFTDLGQDTSPSAGQDAGEQVQVTDDGTKVMLN